MDWFPCNGNEGWYPREAGRQTHLLWVWQLVCLVYGLSQQPGNQHEYHVTGRHGYLHSVIKKL
jgi:hypothetical protein